ALLVLLDPSLPVANPRADVERRLDLEVVVLREGEDEAREPRVLLFRDHAGLRILVEAVVVRFVEATELVHTASLVREGGLLQRPDLWGLAAAAFALDAAQSAQNSGSEFVVRVHVEHADGLLVLAA